MVDISKLTDKEKMELTKKGICAVCGNGTQVGYTIKNGQTIQHFSCGHQHISVSIAERVTFADSLAVHASGQITELEKSAPTYVQSDLYIIRSDLDQLKIVLDSMRTEISSEKSMRNRFLDDLRGGIIGFVLGYAVNILLRVLGIPA